MANPTRGRQQVDSDELAFFKGAVSNFGAARESTVEIWPETLPAIRLFTKCLTQWRAGPTGVIGLDYNVVDRLMDYDEIPLRERAELLTEISHLERGYLSEIRRK
ncbi:MAG: hypothetical protein CMK92_05220 [Pseudomonas sp.]|nr:hypothetical protein [Pseudomonas sp.]